MLGGGGYFGPFAQHEKAEKEHGRSLLSLSGIVWANWMQPIAHQGSIMHIQDVLLKLKATGVFARPASLICFVAAAVVTPFVLLTVGGSESNNLPWYFWALVPLLLLVVISVGYLKFTRESHEAKDISIRPDHR